MLILTMGVFKKKAGEVSITQPNNDNEANATQELDKTNDGLLVKLRSKKLLLSGAIIVLALLVVITITAYMALIRKETDKKKPKAVTNAASLTNEEKEVLKRFEDNSGNTTGGKNSASEGNAKQTQTELSKQTTQESIKNAPNDQAKLNIINDWGDHCFWIKDYKCAIEAYEQYNEIQPNNLTILMQLARCYKELGNKPKALSYLDQASLIAAKIEDPSTKQNVRYGIDNLRKELK